MNMHLNWSSLLASFLWQRLPFYAKNFEMRAPLGRAIRTYQKHLHTALIFMSHSSKGSQVVTRTFHGPEDGGPFAYVFVQMSKINFEERRAD